MAINGYYRERLSAERLRRCYDLAPPRVRQYLDAEIQHVLARIRPGDRVLELGCGYGRALERLADRARLAVGIDSSGASLLLAQALLHGRPNVWLALMNAAATGFRDAALDVVVCIQNGVSAFGVDARTLIAEGVRITRPGGRALFSSYAAAFWPHRLDWFRRQATAGLLGEIDEDATGDGVIVCRDGFRAVTFSPDDFCSATDGLPFTRRALDEVDGSSVFCELER